MEFSELIKKAKEIRDEYKKLTQKEGNKPWGVMEHTLGFVGDVGDLVKLVMAKNKFRNCENVDKKLIHELSDCLWSIIIIADELGIDLESGFLETMDELHRRIETEKSRKK